MEREMKAPLTREAVESIRFHRQHWPESTAWAQEQLLALCDSHELLRARLDAAEQEIDRLVALLDAAMCPGCDQTIRHGHSPDCPLPAPPVDR